MSRDQLKVTHNDYVIKWARNFQVQKLENLPDTSQTHLMMKGIIYKNLISPHSVELYFIFKKEHLLSTGSPHLFLISKSF
jgi:hypothetical protein